MSTATNRPLNLSILATPDTSPSTLFGLYDVLSSIGVGWETFITGNPTSPRFNVRIVAVDKEPFVCQGSGGKVLVVPDGTLDEVEETDIAVIASFVPRDTVTLRIHDHREIDWISRLSENKKVLASICTSTLLLAESGVLDGLESTTFWAYKDLARTRYPKVLWRVDKNVCISGNNGQIVTGGGSTIWQELALYLVARFCGIEQAKHAAKLWVIPERGESQASYAVKPLSIPHEDNVVKDCQGWIVDNYFIANPVALMCQKTGLPSTTFTRRFKRATGDRPMDYIHMIRIEKAKEMLENGEKTVDEIGRDVGYEDSASFRRVFKRKVGLTPSIFRRKFGLGRFNKLALDH